MKFKSLTTLVGLLVVLCAAPAMAQLDGGAPDTLSMEVTVSPCARTGDYNVQLDLYMFNDVNQAFGVSIGIGWDNDNLTADSAKWSTVAFNSYDQIFLFEGGTTPVITNQNKRFVYSGLSFGLFKTGMPPSPTRQHMGTWFFTLSEWSVNDVVNFFYYPYDDGAEAMIIDYETIDSYTPIVDADNEIRDCDYVDCTAPTITCPESPIDEFICAPTTICVEVPIADYDNVTVDGATWVDGQLCFEASATQQYNFHIVASVDCGETAECDVQVNVTMGTTPVITCPGSTVDVLLCDGASTVTLDLPISGYETVAVEGVSGATWDAGTLTFDAFSAGLYNLTVTATADCGTDVCNIVVDVMTGVTPEITCPGAPIVVQTSGLEQECTPLVITGADDVSVTTPQEWSVAWNEGQLCFSPEIPGVYTATIIATGDCGADTCEVTVEITECPPPAITCPDTPIDHFFCLPGDQMFVLVPITDFTSVDVTGGATWSGDTLWYTIGEAGQQVYGITATNDCGQATCDVTVNVTLGTPVVIDCPVDIFQFDLEAPGQICVPIAITGAETVTVEGATWGEGEFCFTADTTGEYNFTVVAANDCFTEECGVRVDVNITPPCVNMQLSETAFGFSGIEGEGTVTPESAMITITSSDSERNFEFTVMAPVGVDWIWFDQSGPGSVVGTTPADIPIYIDPTALTVGIHSAQCVVTTTDEGVCDPMLGTFDITVEIFPQPSADTVIVDGLSAVPGQHVTVPITFANSCALSGASIALAWESADLYLDSVSYAASVLADFTHSGMIDNDLLYVRLNDETAGDPLPYGTGQNWANLHFTVSCEAEAGTYDLVLYEGIPTVETFYFNRNCGEGSEVESPEFIPGAILVDTSATYVCGWVVEPDGMGGYMEVEGATVELWGDFPFDGPDMTTMSSHWGSFAFPEVYQIPFDLWAYKDGYYPGKLEGLNVEDKGAMIVLYPLGDLMPTDMWVDYYCETNTMMGAPLPVGSIVEAYDPDGVLCGRQYVDTAGLYRFMPVYRDSSGSVVDEGAMTGDIISFYINGEEAMATGDVVYPEAYDQIQVCLEAGATITKTCELMEGWNLISWNINTESDYITDVLGPYMDCIDVILGFEHGGLTYDPDLQRFSTLWYVDHLSGYWVKVKEGCEVTLEIEGLPVLANTPIPVDYGWNLVSYLPDYPMPPTEALTSVNDALMIAYGFDEGVMIYQPGMAAQNTLDMMNSCFGYWLKVDADGHLVYPVDAPAVGAPAADPHTLAAARLAPGYVTPTTSWINLYSSNLTLDGEIVQAGATISARNSEGKAIGGFTMTDDGSFGFMPVYADDAGNRSVTNLQPGQKFYLAIDDVETNEEFVWTNNGDRLEITTLTAKSASGTTLPDTYMLGQNYPNPFNPSTNISFSMATAGKAKLQIYNVLGKLVAVPYDGMASAGENIVVWDGRNSLGEQVSSGVYFYRLTAGDFSETKKMMLLK